MKNIGGSDTVAEIKSWPLDRAKADPMAGAKSHRGGPLVLIHKTSEMPRTLNAYMPFIYGDRVRSVDDFISADFNKINMRTRNPLKLPFITFQLRNIGAFPFRYTKASFRTR